MEWPFSASVCTCMHLHCMRVRVCMYGTCVYVYAFITCVYVHAFTLHACTCMHVRYMRACTVHACTCMHLHCMRVRVCMYGTCVNVYACTVHACTCMHLRVRVPAYTCMHLHYMRVRVCIYITCVYVHVYACMVLASFPGLSGEEGKAWGLLRAHARKLPKKVVIAYYSSLSVTFVSILSVKACERG